LIIIRSMIEMLQTIGHVQISLAPKFDLLT
jgi:hypothetical protein